MLGEIQLLNFKEKEKKLKVYYFRFTDPEKRKDYLNFVVISFFPDPKNFDGKEGK